MLISHNLPRRTLDLCIAAFYVAVVSEKERPGNTDRQAGYRSSLGGEKARRRLPMKLAFITRYLEERRRYWKVLHELSSYTDRELQDIGIDRADIAHIARQAARG
jgi:uncharacterized protein YjiS (DUF1127 family)